MQKKRRNISYDKKTTMLIDLLYILEVNQIIHPKTGLSTRSHKHQIVVAN